MQIQSAIYKKVDQIKDLGILYNSQLTFKDHIQEKIIKHILWLDYLKETLSVWIQEFLSRFTKHWSLLMLSMLIQFGPFTKKEI